MLDIDTTQGDVITADFELIPTGWYLAQAIEGSVEPQGNGQRLKLTWELLDGPYAKRRVWQSEWAAHDNATAQEIGQKMIRTLGQAVGTARVTDARDLMFKPVEIRVGLTKKEAGYEQRNEVKSARRAGSAPAPVGAPAPAAATAGASAPWRS
jgi:hypothetical protein